jgi:hypothetical protein
MYGRIAKAGKLRRRFFDADGGAPASRLVAGKFLPDRDVMGQAAGSVQKQI